MMIASALTLELEKLASVVCGYLTHFLFIYILPFLSAFCVFVSVLFFVVFGEHPWSGLSNAGLSCRCLLGLI